MKAEHWAQRLPRVGMDVGYGHGLEGWSGALELTNLNEQGCGETARRVTQKLNVELPCGPAIPLLGA